MRISDWSSDVCSSDLRAAALRAEAGQLAELAAQALQRLVLKLAHTLLGDAEPHAEAFQCHGFLAEEPRMQDRLLAGRQGGQRGADPAGTAPRLDAQDGAFLRRRPVIDQQILPGGLAGLGYYGVQRAVDRGQPAFHTAA